MDDVLVHENDASGLRANENASTSAWILKNMISASYEKLAKHLGSSIPIAETNNGLFCSLFTYKPNLSAHGEVGSTLLGSMSKCHEKSSPLTAAFPTAVFIRNHPMNRVYLRVRDYRRTLGVRRTLDISVEFSHEAFLQRTNVQLLRDDLQLSPRMMYSARRGYLTKTLTSIYEFRVSNVSYVSLDHNPSGGSDATMASKPFVS